MIRNESMNVDRPDLVPAGAFSYPVKDPRETRWFGFLLLPQFTLLAFSAALDPLRIANQLAQKPLYGWLAISDNGDAVSSSSGIDIDVHGNLSDLNPICRSFRGAGHFEWDPENNQYICPEVSRSNSSGAIILIRTASPPAKVSPNTKL